MDTDQTISFSFGKKCKNNHLKWMVWLVSSFLRCSEKKIIYSTRFWNLKVIFNETKWKTSSWKTFGSISLNSTRKFHQVLFASTTYHACMQKCFDYYKPKSKNVNKFTRPYNRTSEQSKLYVELGSVRPEGWRLLGNAHRYLLMSYEHYIQKFQKVFVKYINDVIMEIILMEKLNFSMQAISMRLYNWIINASIRKFSSIELYQRIQNNNTHGMSY